MKQINPIKIGVLGCANIATRSIIPALISHPSFSLGGIASREKAKAAHWANVFSTTPMNYEELISSDVQAVYIPLPNGLHAEWIKKCLDAGKHVLVEKSMCVHFDDVVRLNETARMKGLVLVENFQFRFHRQHQEVLKILNAGVIGDVRCFRSSFGFPPFPDKDNIRYKKELGGGALFDAGAYPVKATSFIFGNIEKVSTANLVADPVAGVDIFGTASLRVNATIESQISFGFDHYYQCNYEIWGSQGWLRSDRAFTAHPDLSPKLILETSKGREVIEVAPDNHFYNMLSHFSGLISGNDPSDEYTQNILQARIIWEISEHAKR